MAAIEVTKKVTKEDLKIIITGFLHHFYENGQIRDVFGCGQSSEEEFIKKSCGDTIKTYIDAIWRA